MTKLNATGSVLVYSTYLGGSGSDGGYGITIDTSGNAYVTGYTLSTNFPTTAGAYQTTRQGSYDAFVTKLNATGSALFYSTYLGGSDDDEGYRITIDSSGNAYVTGYTESTNFPTTAGAYQTTYQGNRDAFVTKLSITPAVPMISVSPASFNFGDVVVGQTSPPPPFVVTNTGSANLTISLVSITGTNATEFNITSDTCAGATLPPGATCTIVVVFSPVTAGPKSASLTLVSNADNAPVLNVPLSGNGVIPPGTTVVASVQSVTCTELSRTPVPNELAGVADIHLLLKVTLSVTLVSTDGHSGANLRCPLPVLQFSHAVCSSRDANTVLGLIRLRRIRNYRHTGLRYGEPVLNDNQPRSRSDLPGVCRLCPSKPVPSHRCLSLWGRSSYDPNSGSVGGMCGGKQGF